jgi:hypothetical protein
MARHRADWWKKRIDDLTAGGDAEAISKRYNVTTKTLYWWRAELARRARSPPIPEGTPAFVAMVTERAPTLDTSTGDATSNTLDLVVEVGRARLTLRGAVSTGHLEALVRGLAAQC